MPDDMATERRHGHAPHPVWSWAWLVASVASRAYLSLLATLAVCALSPLIFGMTATIVHGGSMRPHITAGDVVLSTHYDPATPIPLGRVVTFEAPSGSGLSGLIMHRVVAIKRDGSLSTAGDAQVSRDRTPISRTDIISEARVLIPLIGSPAWWLISGNTIAFLAWIGITALAVGVEVLGAPPRKPTSGKSQRGLPAIPGPPVRSRLGTHVARAPVASTILFVSLIATSLLGSDQWTQAHAGFSGKSTSIGNSWTYPASQLSKKLVFVTSPNNSTGGVRFTRQPVVEVRDVNNVRVPGSRAITLAITTAAGAILTCTANPLTTTTGTAAFAGCAIDHSGTYTLTATSGTLTAAGSSSFVVSVGPAIKLAFTTSPVGNTAGTAFATQPTVVLQDAGGNRTSGTSSVRLAITTPAGATLACNQNPRNTSNGSVTFSGCSINTAGAYSLTATSGTLGAGVSAPFVMTSVPPKPLVCQSQTWMAVFSWTPTPQVPTTYRLYVNGIEVPATGADGWNSLVQLTSNNVPVSIFPAGTATVEVRQVLASGTEVLIGKGNVVLGSALSRTYTCG